MTASVQSQLNRGSPSAATGHLGDVLADLVVQHNALLVDLTALRTKFIAALAKLDADAGVTDTNYAALETPAALTAAAIADLESRGGR